MKSRSLLENIGNGAITLVDRAQGRRTQRLNQHWAFRLCDAPADIDDDQMIVESAAPQRAGWESIAIPHTVRLEPLNASGGRNFQGVCWYTRTLPADPGRNGRVSYLRFDGAMQVCDVWLNGRPIFTHFGGYTPFVIDVTSYLHNDRDNTLLLRLDNTDNADVPPGKPQAELDFCYFGGLYRDVWLETVDPLHISNPIHADRIGGGGVLVTYPAVSSEHATVSVQVDLRNTGDSDRTITVAHELLDSTGRTAATATSAPSAAAADDFTRDVQTLGIDHPLLWHPHTPHCYTLLTRVLEDGEVLDSVSTVVGIRRIEISRDDGLFINGEKFCSLGANRHQEHPYVGNAMSDSAQWRDAVALRSAGFTSVRSHYPQAPAFMDACDALGILTIVSNPGWQFVGNELFRERAVANARTMVRRDRNHPSVILWEAALNETDNRVLGQRLHRAVHEELPGDQCFTAGDHEAGFAPGGVDAEHATPPAWDVVYWHNDGSKPFWVREWGDAVDNWSDQQSANRVARGWGETPMLIQAQAHLARMDELWVGHHGTSSGPDGRRLAGACLWAAVDCQRGYHHQPFYGGVLDAMRLPKFNHYLFQSQQSPNVSVSGIACGPMVFIANFATFLSPTVVTIFSNCEQVRLMHGDKIVDVREPDAGHRVAHPPFTFRVGEFAEQKSTMYMTGVAAATDAAPLTLRAEGIIGGRVVAVHEVLPPGVAKKIRLEVDTAGHPLIADGADFVRVHARVCDARGTVCVTAEDHVHFEVDGPGEIIDGPGVGANPFRAEAGIATALVRAGGVGRLHVRASAFGLEAAELDVEAVSIDSINDRE